ncbi:MAG: chemotaxis protein CheW [Leptolyngbya sp. SIO3F4]|nr:chemotaxis protein CheW [Leptolyngbya sp. SIO3F4]
MAILSPLKSRRLRSHKGDTTQQVIVFQIQHEWFALPIFAVKKVVPKSDTHGDYHNSGAGLTVHEGKELLVLDISHQVFGNINKPLSSPAAQTLSSSTEEPSQGYLLIIQSRQGDLVGLPIKASPTVRRFSQSSIVPLPSNYAARVNIQCVSGLIVQAENQPILFLLNSDQLLHSQPLLPPMS